MFTGAEQTAWSVLKTSKTASELRQTSIGSLGLKVKEAFGYWFDFGDDWSMSWRRAGEGDEEGLESQERVQLMRGSWKGEGVLEAGIVTGEWHRKVFEGAVPEMVKHGRSGRLS